MLRYCAVIIFWSPWVRKPGSHWFFDQTAARMLLDALVLQLDCWWSTMFKTNHWSFWQEASVPFIPDILHWSMHSLPLSKDCKREKWNCACALSRQNLETHNPISIETSGLGGELAFACFLFPEGFSVAYIISKMKEVIKIVVLKKVKRCLNTNKIKG